MPISFANSFIGEISPVMVVMCFYRSLTILLIMYLVLSKVKLCNIWLNIVVILLSSHSLRVYLTRSDGFVSILHSFKYLMLMLLGCHSTKILNVYLNYLSSKHNVAKLGYIIAFGVNDCLLYLSCYVH